MKYQPSILNIGSLCYLFGVVIFTILNYAELNEGEGWGMVGMFGLFGYGLLLLLIDLVIQRLFKRRSMVNMIGGIVFLIGMGVLVFVNDNGKKVTEFSGHRSD